MGDIAVIIEFKIAPKNAPAFEAAIGAYFEAMAEEEYPAGGVKACAAYGVPNVFGYYYLFAHYTEDGFKASNKSKKVEAAGIGLRKFLVEPPRRRILEAVIVQGCGERIRNAPPRPKDADPKQDVGAVYSFRVEPEDDARLEQKMREIFEIVERAESSTGNVMTYNLYRVRGAPGHWAMFEHFTAKGAADHATDPSIFGPGMEQVNMLPEPASRVVLGPKIVHGCGEPMPTQCR